MEEKVLQHKKNGMLVLILTTFFISQQLLPAFSEG